MSKSGVGGRGRGWLNLTKHQQNNVPISAPIGIVDQPKPLPVSGKEETQFSDAKEFKGIINRVKDINICDDGIKFNQKIKYILENWKEDCQNSDEVEKSFDALYEGCLNDDELASKLVIMISSRSFISQEVHDQNIRLIFLRKLQNNFDDSKILCKTNPVAFRNSVRMLGEFYNKAKLANGQPFTFMLNPLVSYLDMLLESTQVLDLQQFATQIFLNGSAIKAECSDKVTELFNKVRLVLVSDSKLSQEGKLWLLLSLDIAGNKFGMLPIEIFKFYQEQIGAAELAPFQGANNTLSVQTPEDNKSLENYQSTVNVLQLSTKPDIPTNTQANTSTVSNNSDLSSSRSNTSGFGSDTSSQNLNNSKESSQKSGKFGRPILGAGARLIKNKMNDSSSNNWRSRDNSSSGWGKSGGWKDQDKNGKSKNKGWEHDDRFDSDYS